ncbi:MAG: hypothetical protein COU63_01615 [Candidatus Pacebacteria bacterium CG10_big_fil_rev_8_21_14_0_10_36_11]|nr:hypothetical protein [Candidatus Pacearchaeota archaeon]OIP73716.1 MAG: hypothetical protein AUK08_04105 [Candidatus Pacebacteria bacterium CG2_30_36_39]PIR64698.1 MAG: hypothetical protein COU63_01615 [Candidatus Pacebacteria bacterium CG10_big_fil_rev_8_21_14_0_10_36_11]PJC43083.1 MAG: hypothetical protein CO040_01010 [Candidatus Pacebacteria bacterium CG_4_9_14_0_2_um_filter_36_8]
MENILPTVLVVISIILTIILSVVGIQIILVLAEVKKTLNKVNTTLDQAEAKINSLISPLQNLGGLASGLQTGVKVFESFTGWLTQRRNETKKK